MSDLYVDGLPVGTYLKEVIRNGREDTRNAGDMFWASQEVWPTSDAREVLQVEFSGYRLVNHLAFAVSRFPHTVRAEYWDAEVSNWKPLRAQTGEIIPLDPAYSIAAQRALWEGEPVSHTIVDSYPVRITSARGKVLGATHPQHSGSKHWVPVTWRVTPVYTRAIRLILTRPGYYNTEGMRSAFPTDAAGNLVAYSLAVKELQVGYRVYGEGDIPDAYRASLTDFATSADLLGSRLSYRLKTYSPQGVVGEAEGLHWRSEPQPVNYAVVNFYADVRDAHGNGQVIDRFYIDPLTVGPVMNLYYTNDEPDADFEADDSPLTYPVARVNGAEPVVLRNPATGEALGLDFSAAPGNVQFDNGHLQWDPAKPWWLGLTVRLETETGTHPWFAWSGNTLRQRGREVEIVTATGEVHTVGIPASVAVGDDFSVALIWRPEEPGLGTLTPEEGGFWVAESTLTLAVGSPEDYRIRTRQVQPDALGGRPETLYLGSYSIGKVWRQASAPEPGVTYRWTGTPGASASERYVDGQLAGANHAVRPKGDPAMWTNATTDVNPDGVLLQALTTYTQHVMAAPGTTVGGSVDFWSPDARTLTISTRGAVGGSYGSESQTSTTVDLVPGVNRVVFPEHTLSATSDSFRLNIASANLAGVRANRVFMAIGPHDGTYFDGDTLDDRQRDLWYDTDNGDLVHSWNTATNAWESGTGNLVVQAEPSDLVLRGLMVKADDMPGRGYVEGFMEDPSLFYLKARASTLDLTRNALLRIHPSFWEGTNLAAAVGGPGDRYEDAIWTPIPRDYTLRQGFVRFPPVRAKHFKFEFTNLVHMHFENLVPIRRAVRLFPTGLVEQYQRLIAPDAGDTTYRAGLAFDGQQYDYTSQAPGVQTMMDMITVGNYASAVNRLREVSQNVARQQSRTEAYVAKDPVTAKTLADLGWVWSFAPWHIAASAPRWANAQPHEYEIVRVDHDTKVGFFVGIKHLRPFRVDYLTDDDTEVYEETFADDLHIADLSGMEFTDQGISAFSNAASVTSKVLPSTRNVRGVQFASVQSDAIALLPDDGFVNPDLGANWSAYGDASLTRLEGQGVLLTRGVMAETGGGGGIASGAVFASSSGRIYAAARLTPQTVTGGPVRLEIVSLHTGTVLAAEERTLTVGEEAVLQVGYEVGSANTRLTYGDLEAHTYGELEEGAVTGGDNIHEPGTYGDLESNPIDGPVFVRLRQLGTSRDRILVERLSLFDQPVVWQFSVDGGATWYDGMSVRNNPEAVLTFPEPGKELVWRALVHHMDAEVSALTVRPWYGGLIGSMGRSADDFVGPNRSVLDDYSDTADDPMWQQSHDPVPGWWYQRDVANQFSAAPNILVDGVVVLPPSASE